jgi:hypothetical protein
MSRKKSIYCIFFTFNTVYCEKPVNTFCLSANRFGALEGYAMKRGKKINRGAMAVRYACGGPCLVMAAF